jgi:hypothetical protein
MKNFLKMCDFYGTQFHWYFERRQKYYSSHGGIFSLISFFSYIAFIIIFGFKDFKRTQSISTISNIPPSGDKTIKFGKQKLYLPWRIMDYGDTFINHTGILYPRIYYFTNRYNNQTQLMETNFKLLNYSLCNETSMKNLGKDYILNSNLDKLFCIDMEDLEMGGSWNSKFINYLRLDLNLCKDGANYNDNNANCTHPDHLISLFGKDNNWFFELLYPSVQFQPNNKDRPIFVLYNSYYYGLNTNSNKVDRIYLQEHIFEDEQGWIFNHPIKNSTYWGVNSIKSDFYTAGRDIFRHGSTSRLYSLKLYIDYGTVYYYRKYKKIYEIISEILPIMKIVTGIFAIISETINKLQVSKRLNEYIIDDKVGNLNPKMNNLIFHVSNNYIAKTLGILDNNNLESNKMKKNLKPHSFIKREDFSGMKDSSKLFFLNNNKLNLNKNNNKNNKAVNPEDLKKKHRHTINVSKIIGLKPIEFFNKDKVKFPFKYYFIGSILNIISSKNRNNYLCISEKFNRSFTFFTHIIDITSYISIYKQFESLKKIIVKSIKTNKSESNNEIGKNINFLNLNYN